MRDIVGGQQVQRCWSFGGIGLRTPQDNGRNIWIRLQEPWWQLLSLPTVMKVVNTLVLCSKAAKEL
jgi:hypothetical protein